MIKELSLLIFGRDFLGIWCMKIISAMQYDVRISYYNDVLCEEPFSSNQKKVFLM